MATKKFTTFGKTVRRIMESRDIYNWIDLYRALDAQGCPLSRQQIMNYVRGDSVADERFVAYLNLALNLGEKERDEIAYAWGYEQNREDEKGPKTAIHKVADALGWDEDEKREKAVRYLFGVSHLVMSA